MMKKYAGKSLILVVFAFMCFTWSHAKTESAPENANLYKPVEIKPEEFDGVDPCLRDTTGPRNDCARKYGVVRTPGGKAERPCTLMGDAVEALKRARKIMKKSNPDLELIVISSYRPPGHQQCLWVSKEGNKFKCNSAVCGPRDRKTRKRLPCKFYDLTNPRYTNIFNNCPHVNYRTIDVCAYNRKQVPINERNQMDLSKVADCRSGMKGKKLPKGWIYHPSCCRFTNWTADFRTGSARARKLFGDGPVEAQLEMIRALRKAGWRDNVKSEWWHFRYVSGK